MALAISSAVAFLAACFLPSLPVEVVEGLAAGKSNRPEGKTFYGYMKDDTARFIALAKAAEQALPAAVSMAASSKAAGPISTKLVNAMLPTVAQACGLKA